VATCGICTQEMTYAWTCDRTRLHRDGSSVPLLRWWREDHPGPAGRSGRCPHCAVFQGGFHHLGCPLGLCPLCGQPLDGCPCRYDERTPLPHDQTAA